MGNEGMRPCDHLRQTRDRTGSCSAGCWGEPCLSAVLGGESLLGLGGLVSVCQCQAKGTPAVQGHG